MGNIYTYLSNVKDDNTLKKGRDYYIYKNLKYIWQFPLDWAQSHTQGTGPVDCGNCAYYGTTADKLFVGYCLSCAKLYNYERGIGFDYGFEEPRHLKKSAYTTYLHDVNKDLLVPQDYDVFL